MAVEYKLVPKQITDRRRPRLDNLYFDVFEDGKWQGSRRLTTSELAQYANAMIVLHGYEE